MTGLTEGQARALVALARSELVRSYGGDPPLLDESALPHGVLTGGVFATLYVENELRGCIGYLLTEVDIVELTRRAVVSAARNDPRFDPVSFEELTRVRISLSVLTPSERISDVSEIEVGRHGIIVERGRARGLLLPQVAEEHGWDRYQFLAATCRKAGLPAEAWRDAETVVMRFEGLKLEE
jgi:AmmeMemoRadiSam system protein A